MPQVLFQKPFKNEFAVSKIDHYKLKQKKKKFFLIVVICIIGIVF